MFVRVNIGENELVEKKSKFIALSRAIDCRDDVKHIIDGLWSAHKAATHICYAFIADEDGHDFGYYDDGEPSGTAGKPIYTALVSSGARKTLIAVVRYFGGIKLGTGGLTRAYRAAATELIDKVGFSRNERFVEYGIEASGEAYKKMCASLSKTPSCTVANIIFCGDVTFDVTAPPTLDMDALSAQFGARIVKRTEKYVAVTGE
ncbi:MAG: YigZ family protein [Clostridiales bacterium]|nr:YigZ family protein [Clostridiales bacterium]